MNHEKPAASIKAITKERVAVMQAFLDGKVIECRDRDDEHDPWECVSEPRWLFDEFDYRVKPEVKYRPMHLHEYPLIFWVRFKHTPGTSYLPIALRAQAHGTAAAVWAAGDGDEWFLDGTVEWSVDRRDWHSCMTEDES